MEARVANYLKDLVLAAPSLDIDFEHYFDSYLPLTRVARLPFVRVNWPLVSVVRPLIPIAVISLPISLVPIVALLICRLVRIGSWLVVSIKTACCRSYARYDGRSPARTIPVALRMTASGPFSR